MYTPLRTHQWVLNNRALCLICDWEELEDFGLHPFVVTESLVKTEAWRGCARKSQAAAQAHPTGAVLIKLPSIHPRDLLTPIIRLTPLPSSISSYFSQHPPYLTPHSLSHTHTHPQPTIQFPALIMALLLLRSKPKGPAQYQADGGVCFTVCCLNFIRSVALLVLTWDHYCAARNYVNFHFFKQSLRENKRACYYIWTLFILKCSISSFLVWTFSLQMKQIIHQFNFTQSIQHKQKRWNKKLCVRKL